MLYSPITSRDALITLRGANSTPALIEHILPSLDHVKCIGRAQKGNLVKKKGTTFQQPEPGRQKRADRDISVLIFRGCC